MARGRRRRQAGERSIGLEEVVALVVKVISIMRVTHRPLDKRRSVGGAHHREYEYEYEYS